MNPIRIEVPKGSGAIPMTMDQAKQIFGPDLEVLLKDGEMRLSIRTFGPWSIVHHITGHAIDVERKDPVLTWVETAVTFYGKRSMSDCRESGHCIKGRTSIKGKKVRSFTSGMLIDIAGKLVEIGTIHACANPNPKPKEA